MAFSNKKYWLKEDASTAVDHLTSYHDQWSLWNVSPVRTAWIRNFIAYNSALINPSSWDTSLIQEGSQGELLKFYTPMARSLVRQLVTLISKQRLAFQAEAQSGGNDVLKDVKLANSLLNRIVIDQTLNLKSEDLIELALVCGGGFLKTTWNTAGGEPYDTYRGKIVYTGEVQIDVKSVFDVFYDVNVDDWQKLDWVECRSIKNRYDLIAEHPNLEDELLALPSWTEVNGINYWFDQKDTTRSDDMVSIYQMYSRPTPAVPKGRMLIYGSSECVLYDGHNPYGFIPIEPMMPEKIQGTTIGYPKLTDLLPANEMLDNSMSAIATNQSQFGVQSVCVPRGSNINVQDLNGMRFVSYTPQNSPGGGKPEPLQLTASPPEIFKFAEQLDKYLSELSGIQPVLRGQATATSGSMVATMTATAIEFLDSISKNYHLCLERTMHNAIRCYKTFAKLEHNLTIEGKKGQVYNKVFKGDDIKNIKGVKIVVSSPMMQTTAGRMEIASQLQQMPEEFRYQYIQLLEGHPLSDITEKYTSQSDLVWTENEKLIDGEQVMALATDDHPYHVKHHSMLLNDPDIRNSSDRIEAILAHIAEHVQLEQDTDKALLAMVRGGEMKPTGPEITQQKQAEEMMAPPGVEDVPEGIEKESQVASPATDELGRGV
tara:strand:- start:230 stop:2197 length:1968 start_codon:yes stop_codon:yes gene_type:complete